MSNYYIDSETKETNNKKTKNEIIEYLLSNCEDSHRILMKDKKFHSVNDEKWTIADLFIRQELNNACDGFGMKNVNEVFCYLVENKEQLIEYDLLSKKGFNNCGYPLWKNYDFDFSWLPSHLEGKKKDVIFQFNAIIDEIVKQGRYEAELSRIVLKGLEEN